MKKTVLVILLFALNGLIAQSTISGKVTDASTGEALIGANVFLKGTGYGAATDVNGNYEFSAPNSRYTFVVTYVGYVDFEENINLNGSLEKSVKMNEDLFSREVVVTAQRAKIRETPVPFTDVPVAEIESRIATQDIPMLLNDVPGVYASETGGGAGDSRVSIRGFSTENLSIMINGVPVNDMENGVVYWSNWSGLGDVTSSIQIQRGLGASKLSTASVGGTVNLLTKSTDATRKTIFKSEVGAYNTQKYTAAFSTGLMENNLALSMMISRKTGDGYVDNTWSNDFVYFISIGKLFDNHVLNVNFTGTPQNHGQRSQNHSTRTYAEKGLDWNMDWGTLNGKRITVRENFYHKPVLDINHIWKMTESTTWTNVLYGSWGTGGGTGELTRSLSTGGALPDGGTVTTSAQRFGSFMTVNRETNQLDIDKVYAANLVDQAAGLGANNIIRSSRNDHNWYGLISTIDMKMDNNLSFTLGFDGRYYKGEHFREVENLLGAEYFLDDDNKNTGGPVKRYVGDKIDYYNDGLVRQIGFFAQAEMVQDDMSLFVNGSFNSTAYKRVDYFTYLDSDPLQETDWQSYTGLTIKGGINYNISPYSNIFLNAGFISKVPLFDAVFLNFVNDQINENVKNEKVISFDLGYGLSTSDFALSANAYYTTWSDRFYSTSRTFQVSAGPPIVNEDYEFNAYDGISQRHIGFEMLMKYKLSNSFTYNFGATHALNEYSKDFEVTGVNRNTVNPVGPPTQAGTIYADGIFVGDQPMTVVTSGINYEETLQNGNRFFFNPRVRHTARHYADFDVVGRLNNIADKGAQAWKLPDYTMLDISLGYTFVGENSDSWFNELSITLNIFNAMDIEYITDATDNASNNFTRYNDGARVDVLEGNHSERSAMVYYGRERFASLNLQISL